MLLGIEHGVDEIDLDEDGGEVVGVAQVRQEQHQDGLPPDLVHVHEAELHEGPQEAETHLENAFLRDRVKG